MVRQVKAITPRERGGAKEAQAITGSRRTSVIVREVSSSDSRTIVRAQGRHFPQQLPRLSWLRTSCSDPAPEAIACRMALSDTL